MQDNRFYSSWSLTVDLSCLLRPYSSDFGALSYDARDCESTKRPLRIRGAPCFECSNATIKFKFGTKNAENILHI